MNLKYSATVFLFLGTFTDCLAPHSIPRRAFVTSGVTAGLLAFSSSTSAYERRDVGDGNRSPATAAMNEQAYRTNNRLEASGFKLDTREEEQERLSNALASFSYDDSTSKKKGASSSYTNARPSGATKTK